MFAQLHRMYISSNYLRFSVLACFLGGYKVQKSSVSALFTNNKYVRSPFLNLGLWTVCFHLFRHPKVQFDHLYNGCYSVWGDSLKMIAYWVVPGWMILIQVMATCSLITALTAQLLSISILLRLPLQIVLRLISTHQCNVGASINNKNDFVREGFNTKAGI